MSAAQGLKEEEPRARLIGPEAIKFLDTSEPRGYRLRWLIQRAGPQVCLKEQNTYVSTALQPEDWLSYQLYQANSEQVDALFKQIVAQNPERAVELLETGIGPEVGDAQMRKNLWEHGLTAEGTSGLLTLEDAELRDRTLRSLQGRAPQKVQELKQKEPTRR